MDAETTETVSELKSRIPIELVVTDCLDVVGCGGCITELEFVDREDAPVTEGALLDGEDTPVTGGELLDTEDEFVTEGGLFDSEDGLLIEGGLFDVEDGFEVEGRLLDNEDALVMESGLPDKEEVPLAEGMLDEKDPLVKKSGMVDIEEKPVTEGGLLDVAPESVGLDELELIVVLKLCEFNVSWREIDVDVKLPESVDVDLELDPDDILDAELEDIGVVYDMLVRVEIGVATEDPVVGVRELEPEIGDVDTIEVLTVPTVVVREMILALCVVELYDLGVDESEEDRLVNGDVGVADEGDKLELREVGNE